MKNVLWMVFLGLLWCNLSIAAINLIEKKKIDNSEVKTVCIDGYKFVITSSSTGEAIVQVFKSRGGKLSYPLSC